MIQIPYGFCHCGCARETRRADRTNPQKDWVKGQPYRFLTGHCGRKALEYVVSDCGYATPCWMWQKHVGKDGYGRVTVADRFILAHRMMYERVKGLIPKGLTLDHLCRVRCCVNPDHLDPVTHLVNHRRRVDLPLNEADVVLIRQMLRDGLRPPAIAPQFKVHVYTIWMISWGRTWKGVGQ